MEHLDVLGRGQKQENKYAKQFQEIADFLRKAEDRARLLAPLGPRNLTPAWHPPGPGFPRSNELVRF